MKEINTEVKLFIPLIICDTLLLKKNVPNIKNINTYIHAITNINMLWKEIVI